MQSIVRHRRLVVPLLVAVVVLAVAVVALAGRDGGGDDELVVYNGRSQYGDETVFRDFERDAGLTMTLRGGTAPELFERLRSEGPDTPADVLVTTDLANLWRAKEAGVLQPATSATLERQVPEANRDPDEQWWGLSARIRTPMRSTTRVPADEVTSYEDLAKSQFKGKLCLRTSSNEYNQSLVADWLAKRGPAATERLLRSWMANDPEIVGSDVDVLEAIASGRCDVGLTNHYYLARILEEDGGFPVTPAWPDQDGAGAHTNFSGAGVVRDSAHAEQATALLEHLTSPAGQQEIVANGELAADARTPPQEHIADWAEVKQDPIDVAKAGALLPDAVALMQEVGWK
jgi:iron(III) transport system substrate-binding protein